ncbi:MAG TPA: hypothetical protein VMU50_07775, partial [Polyangia bacterium]|nr:hypothetical protein [Polyangia bacterium]
MPPKLGIARKLSARGHPVQVLGDPTLEAEARADGLRLQPLVDGAAPDGRLGRLRDRIPDGIAPRAWRRRCARGDASTPWRSLEELASGGVGGAPA